jgi:hypothetical protein
MSPNRIALALLLIGLVLLPGPAYAVGLDRLDGPDRYRVSTGYQTTAVDISNDSALAEEYIFGLAFLPEDMQFHYINEDYLAPNRTQRVLERAIRNGSATTRDQAVEADLQQLQRTHPLLTLTYRVYYVYSVSSTGGTTTIEATRANESQIAALVRANHVVSYQNLTKAEQRTFRKIRNATDDPDQYDYRPWSDEPLPERPIVERNGTYYVIEGSSDTDDFNFPAGFLLGFVASGLGLIALILSGGVWLYARWRG